MDRGEGEALRIGMPGGETWGGALDFLFVLGTMTRMEALVAIVLVGEVGASEREATEDLCILKQIWQFFFLLIYLIVLSNHLFSDWPRGDLTRCYTHVVVKG